MIGIISGLITVAFIFSVVRFMFFPMMWRNRKFGITKEERDFVKKEEARWSNLKNGKEKLCQK